MTKLKLQKGSSLIFMGTRTWTKTGSTNTLNFVKFGCPVSYLNHEFIYNPNELLLAFPINTPVDVEFSLGQYNGRTSLNLESVQPVQQTVKA